MSCNSNLSQKSVGKRASISLARQYPLYFCRYNIPKQYRNLVTHHLANIPSVFYGEPGDVANNSELTLTHYIPQCASGCTCKYCRDRITYPIVRYSGPTTKAVRRTFKATSFASINQKEWSISKYGLRGFNICWGGPKPIAFFTKLAYGQLVNQMPGSSCMGRKDHLAKIMRESHSRRGCSQFYNFVPKSWILPLGITEFKTVLAQNTGKIYIYKPSLGARGEGIKLIGSIDDLPANFNNISAVVQEYITNPLCVHGYKFDLRVYALITSIDPLMVYVYKEGLGRFATIKYREPTLKNIKQKCMHLTNFSLNSKFGTFIKPKTLTSDQASKLLKSKSSDVISENDSNNENLACEKGNLTDDEYHDNSVGSDYQDSVAVINSDDEPENSAGTPAATDDSNDDIIITHSDGTISTFASKWKLDDLLQYLEKNHEIIFKETKKNTLVDDLKEATKNYEENNNSHAIYKYLWDEIQSIVVKTIIAAEPHMYDIGHKVGTANAYPKKCFGIYGFDIMFDSTGSAKLIEVNSSPATATGAVLDEQVKFPMLCDALTTVGLRLVSNTGIQFKEVLEKEEDESYIAQSLHPINEEVEQKKVQTTNCSCVTSNTTVSDKRFQDKFSSTKCGYGGCGIYLPYMTEASNMNIIKNFINNTNDPQFSNLNACDNDTVLENQKNLENKIMQLYKENSDDQQANASALRILEGFKCFNSLYMKTNKGQYRTLVNLSGSKNSEIFDIVAMIDALQAIVTDKLNQVSLGYKGLSLLEKLMITQLVEEESRCGDFVRVFPTIDSTKYLKLFKTDRYSNYLLIAFIAWDAKYNKKINIIANNRPVIISPEEAQRIEQENEAQKRKNFVEARLQRPLTTQFKKRAAIFTNDIRPLSK